MIFVLQLILGLFIGFSNICFGMEPEHQEKKWVISEADSCNQTLYSADYTGRGIQGTLQIYYSREESTDYDAARFKSDKGEIIKLSKFDTIDQAKKSVFLNNQCQSNLFIPVCIKDEQNEASTKHLVVTKVTRSKETEGFLDIQRLNLVDHGDTIEFRDSCDNPPKCQIYHPDNINAMRQALSLGKQFIITFKDKSQDDFKITECWEGIFIKWNGWSPSLSSFGNPMELGVSDLKEVTIDWRKEKEKLYDYQKNKWINELIRGGLLVVILAIISNYSK